MSFDWPRFALLLSEISLTLLYFFSWLFNIRIFYYPASWLSESLSPVPTSADNQGLAILLLLFAFLVRLLSFFFHNLYIMPIFWPVKYELVVNAKLPIFICWHVFDFIFCADRESFSEQFCLVWNVSQQTI